MMCITKLRAKAHTVKLYICTVMIILSMTIYGKFLKIDTDSNSWSIVSWRINKTTFIQEQYSEYMTNM